METSIGCIGGFVLMTLFMLVFAIGSAEVVANQKGQSLFNNDKTK